MSRLLQIQDQLLDTTAEITKLERAFGQRQSSALSSSLKSLYKARAGLEEEFKEAAAVAQVDVVSYRLFEGRERPTMSLVGKAMDSFQTLYAILYSAVTSKKPKDTSHLGADAIQQSAFEFAYAYSGSVGFVFTMPNERLLFGETMLDEAMAHLFDLARVKTGEQVKELARRYGFAAVRAIYNWANALCASGSGADIQWKKNDSTKGSLFMQPAQVEALRDLIAYTSDSVEDQDTFGGVLLGYDSKSLSFRFEPFAGDIIRGKISEGADLPPTVTIPKKYRARIKVSTRVRYSNEDPEVNHELMALSALD
jgi:hypothetical protein